MTNTWILLLLLYFIFIHMLNYLEQDYYCLIFLERFWILVPFTIIHKNALNQGFYFVMVFLKQQIGKMMFLRFISKFSFKKIAREFDLSTIYIARDRLNLHTHTHIVSIKICHELLLYIFWMLTIDSISKLKKINFALNILLFNKSFFPPYTTYNVQYYSCLQFQFHN